MSFIRRVVVGAALNGLALYGVAYFLEDVNYKGGLTLFVLGGCVIGILNTLIKPIIKTLSLPLVFITGGLFLVIINTGILWVAKEIIDILHIGEAVLEIQGFTNYLIAGLLFGIINWVEHLFVPTK